MSLRVRVQHLDAKNAIGIWFFEDRENNSVYLAKPLPPMEFEFKGDGAFYLPQPTMEISRRYANDFFQGLINELTNLGYRANTDRIAGELDATKKHLDSEKENHRIAMELLSGVLLR